jgi:hypothetical protein
MQTLTNGYLLPETFDRGNTFFPALEQNIQRLNDHSHNGADSEKLNAESFLGLTDTTSLVPANWTLQPNGLYRALVTMIGSMVFDTKNIRLVANNRVLYADYEKVTSNTFYVYVNDPSLSVTVLYS